jgi:hypothetical protein
MITMGVVNPIKMAEWIVWFDEGISLGPSHTGGELLGTTVGELHIRPRFS